MTVAVDICNSALLRLGQEAIQSLSEDNARARTCSAQYPKTRDRLLSGDVWSFSLVRDELTPSGTTLAWGEYNVFDLPLDSVRLVKVLNSDYQEIRYKIEGRQIIADQEELYILYVSNTAPESKYDPFFNEALALLLASDMAYKFTNSTNLAVTLKQEAEAVVNRSRSKNAQEFGPEEWNFDTFDKSRRLGIIPYEENYYFEE